ncbi:Kievitone hydratase [Fusarium oxysporum f. sp. cubense]|uniref:Kievitone hydratase n=1 Tax=Fusarium oxysporum f. sp. cubense TaxID=61366 RepID=A0A559L9M2_FUSOC|nr:Kievitone hydratase [Fusarium oxysporum f. sp. cubense]
MLQTLRGSTAALLLPLLAVNAASFRSEEGSILSNGSYQLPTSFDIASTQTNREGADGASFWSSSFILGSNNHSYLVLSHVLADPSLYRASILDITDPSLYTQFETLSKPTSFYSDTGVFNASFPDYGFGSTSPSDGLSEMRTWSAVPGAEFDLTFESTSPVLLNGGLGVFKAGNSTVYEWSMPAGKTRGWLNVNGTKVIVDTAQSLTWYDRQWGGAPPNWSWFELHLENVNGTDIPLSIWVWDEEHGQRGVATVRDGGVQNVIPVASLETSGRTFSSKASGATYPLDWSLHLADGTELSISSVRDDQELYAPGGKLPTYEGYVTVAGVYKGSQKVEGYGLIEISPPDAFAM